MRHSGLGASLTVALAMSVSGVSSAFAQDVQAVPADAEQIRQLREQVDGLKQEFEGLRQQYDARLRQLEQRLERLIDSGAVVAAGGTVATGVQTGMASAVPVATSAAADPQVATPDPGAQPAAPTPTPDPGAQPQGPPSGAVPLGSSKVFNPDMSVIGNFVGAAGENDLSDQPSLQLTEAEVAFQAFVDPYARADFFLAASPEGLEIEEGYITFTTLPANMLLKVGKMRAQFGKVNTLHTHMLPTADRPLVTENLVGGEEGMSDAGMSISHLIQNPLLFLDITGEVYRGESNVFQSQERSDLSYVGRIRGYRDLTEGTNLDFGFSFAHGPSDGDAFVPVSEALNKDLYGVDVTFRYRPLRRAIYKRLNLRTELVWSRQDLVRDTQARAFGF
jgi:TolA-binding protein